MSDYSQYRINKSQFSLTMPNSQPCFAVYAHPACRLSNYSGFMNLRNWKGNKIMNQISLTYTILTCVGILGLLGSVAYYGAMNNL